MPQTPTSNPAPSQRVTLRTLRQWMREKSPFAMLTCYDAVTAQWLWRGGVRTMLVGDTAAQFVLGHGSTLPAQMDFMLQITGAVRRGSPEALVMADMPFGSYHCGDDEALRHAIAFVAEAGADAVKLEVDETFVPLVTRMAHAGVPVVAHLGSRPQLKQLQGGRSRSLFHDDADVQRVVDAAVAMVNAGAVMLLLEAVPAEVSERVVQATAQAAGENTVPVIGCGAGPACHGHVVVLHDLLGLTDWHAPFAPVLGNIGQQIQQAASQWVELVASGQYLRDDHPYRMEP